MDRFAGPKDEEKKDHLSQKCGADTGSMFCSDGAEMPSRRDDWKLRWLNVKLQMDSTSSDKGPRAKAKEACELRQELTEHLGTEERQFKPQP